jgi:hypothetical protein
MHQFFNNFAKIEIIEGEFHNFVEAVSKGCFRGLADYLPADYPVTESENIRNLTQTILNVL